LSLAPDLAPAHEALGFVLVTPDLDFAAAEANSVGRELAPADADQIRPELSVRCARSAGGAENICDSLALDPLGVIAI